MPTVANYSQNEFIIINELKNFTFSFSDNEHDNILVSIANSGTLNTFIQKYQSNNTFILFAQTDQGANTQTRVVIKYTDSYHQDPKYWQNITVLFNIFANSYPEYLEPLQNVSISACNWMNVTLPTATDPDGDSFTVSLKEPVPEWIKLIDPTTLSVCPYSSNLTKSQTLQQISIVLIDSTEAQTTNTFYLNIDTSKLFGMNSVSDISLYFSQTFSLELRAESATDVSLVEWSSLQSIKFSHYDVSSKTIFVDGTDMENMGVYWVMISALDGCGKVSYSNRFNMTIKFKYPPVFLKQMDPISLMKGENKLIVYE